MEGRYTRLKWKMLLLVAVGSLSLGGLGLLLLGAFGSGPLHGLVQRLFVWAACSLFGYSAQSAEEAYQLFIESHRQGLFAIGIIVLMLVGFYLAMGHFTHWLDQLRSALHHIAQDRQEPVRLAKELAPLEQDLNTIRLHLLEQEAAGQASENRRRDLVAFLAHDLKTPLTSVVGYLTLLQEGPELDEEERRHYTGVALEKARRLEELLGEFFDISRMDLQTRKAAEGPIQLSILLEQLTDEFYPIFREKGLVCSVDIQPHLTVNGDPDKLARVFDNVLRNAVNYSCDRGEVGLQALRREDRVEIAIRNEGLEIPEGELSNIFEKFYRLDAARSTRTGGAGLGLAIAKEIVELHGGTISAESDGRFTIFRISLPAVD